MICSIQAPCWTRSNSNIKIVHNSTEHFSWNLSDFSSDVLFENLCCLWIVFINSVFQVRPQKIVRGGWDLGNRMARGYRLNAKWVCPLGSTAWGIQEFCSSNGVAPHLARTPQCSDQCLSSFSMQKQTFFASSTTLRWRSHNSHHYLQKCTARRSPLCL